MPMPDANPKRWLSLDTGIAVRLGERIETPHLFRELAHERGFKRLLLHGQCRTRLVACGAWPFAGGHLQTVGIVCRLVAVNKSHRYAVIWTCGGRDKVMKGRSIVSLTN